MIDLKERRISMKDILAHPWVTQDIPSEQEIRKEFELREQKAKAALEE